MSENLNHTTPPGNKRLGIVLIVLPFAAIFFILMSFVVVNTLLQASGSGSGSETIELVRTITNYVLGFLGIMFTLAIMICVPVGIMYLVKKEPSSGVIDERSGDLSASEIPNEIRGWNWGAAGLTIIWGLYHRVWISLLSFIPIINYFWWIIVGIRGNEWAWKKNKWESVAAFKKSQNKWKPWGIAFLFGPLVLILLAGLLIGISDISSESSNIPRNNEIISQSPELKILKGSEVNYSIKYDANKWNLAPPEDNDDFEYQLNHENESAVAIIIAEKPKFGLTALKKMALENLDNASSETSIISEKTLIIDGNEILELKIKANVDNLPLVYFNHYYSGNTGSIQFVTFTYENLFSDLENELQDLLETLEITEIEESAAFSSTPLPEETDEFNYQQQIILEADYSEGYKAGYADGRSISGELGDNYTPPATEERNGAYGIGYLEGFVVGCNEGGFEGCEQIEEELINIINTETAEDFQTST